MKKYLFLLTSIILLLTQRGMSQEPSFFESIFADHQYQGFTLPLNEKQTLYLEIPPGFQYEASGTREDGVFATFLPDGETSETWTRSFIIFLAPNPEIDFMMYAEAISKSPSDDYSDIDSRSIQNVNTFFIQQHGPAIDDSNGEFIEGKEEYTVKLGIEGEEGYVVLAYTIRHNGNLPWAQKGQKYKRVSDEVMDCFAIIEE